MVDEVRPPSHEYNLSGLQGKNNPPCASFQYGFPINQLR
jgi:hypothetical protein